MRARDRRMRIFLAGIFLTFLILSVFYSGCRKANPATRSGESEEGFEEEAEAEGEPKTEGEKGTITLTLYFLVVEDTGFHLAPEKRIIPYTQAVARAAMEELFKGPTPGSSLKPIFPDTVKVLDISIQDGVCTLNVSKEILTDKAKQGGAGAELESLALTSIADTLTEFPTIKKVKLLIEGKQSGQVDGFRVEDFWGHVGLPEYLERDMSVVKPQ